MDTRQAISFIKTVHTNSKDVKAIEEIEKEKAEIIMLLQYGKEFREILEQIREVTKDKQVITIINNTLGKKE